MSLTTEQLAAVNSDARLLAVDAFAGTGKTTLLVAYAEARPRERILYVAFNKSVASEAASRFPRNVDCRTVHSIAYGAVGSRYKNKLANLGAFEVSRALRCGTPRARVVVDALNNWLSSADAALTREHVPLEALEDPAEALDVLAQAQSMWKQMEDPRSPVPMTHDGYLKIWALSNPKLGYDRILLDEAQDTNPVVLDVIVKQQPRVALVLVGDRHQGIYGFRKSMNAMEAVPAEERVAITQSFRFGNDIGAVASELLAVFKAEARSIRGRDDIAVRWTVDRSKPHAILSRTNAGIFDRAAVLVRAKPNARLKFVGGFDRYPFGKILDAYHLWSGANGQVKDPAIARFKTFASMARYGREAGDAEVNGLVRVVDTHRHEIPRLYDEVKRAEVSDDRADAIFSTAHKSKGLEWDQVVLDEDFIELALDGADPGEVDEEEINLLYVALTRAIRSVQLPTNLRAWLTERAEAGATLPASLFADGAAAPRPPGEPTTAGTAAAAAAVPPPPLDGPSTDVETWIREHFGARGHSSEAQACVKVLLDLLEEARSATTTRLRRVS